MLTTGSQYVATRLYVPEAGALKGPFERAVKTKTKFEVLRLEGRGQLELVWAVIERVMLVHPAGLRFSLSNCGGEQLLQGVR